MDSSDVKNVPTKGFDKKWWESHRTSKAKGSGVGKALDAWNDANLPPKGDLEKVNTAMRFEDAFKAVDRLTKALGVAQSMSSSSKETLAAIAKYHAEIAKHEGALKLKYNLARSRFLEDCETFVKRTKDHADFNATGLKNLQEVSQQMQAATQPTSLQTLLTRAENAFESLKVRDQDEVQYELSTSTRKVEAWGVMAKDAAPGESKRSVGNQHMAAATNSLKAAETLLGAIRQHIKGALAAAAAPKGNAPSSSQSAPQAPSAGPKSSDKPKK